MSRDERVKMRQSHTKSTSVCLGLPGSSSCNLLWTATCQFCSVTSERCTLMLRPVACHSYLRTLRYMETSKHHVVYGHYRGVIQAKHGGSETMWQTQIYIYMILLQWSSCKRILNSGMMFHQIRKDQVE